MVRLDLRLSLDWGAEFSLGFERGLRLDGDFGRSRLNDPKILGAYKVDVANNVHFRASGSTFIVSHKCVDRT